MNADVINVKAYTDLTVDHLLSLIAVIQGRPVSDSDNARTRIVTLDEAYSLSAEIIARDLPFDARLASYYIAQFPEVLAMDFEGGRFEDGLRHGLRKALHARCFPAVRAVAVAQYADYDFTGVESAVDTGLAMFAKHLAKHPYAPLRIKPAKIEAYVADMRALGDDRTIALLTGQLNNLASELRQLQATDARNAARGLREAVQYLALLRDGEVTFDLMEAVETPRVLAA